MNISDILLTCEGFEWDEGNKDKNWIKHKVSTTEAEQVFLNEPLIEYDLAHSEQEIRFYCLGKTHQNRLLYISFTVRNKKIRVISARNQDKKERGIYEQNKTVA